MAAASFSCCAHIFCRLPECLSCVCGSAKQYLMDRQDPAQGGVSALCLISVGVIAEHTVLLFECFAHIGGDAAGAHGEFQSDVF